MMVIELNMGTVKSDIASLHLKVIFLFSLIIGVEATPLWGQAIGIKAHLEGDRLIMQIDKDILGKPILFVQHNMGHHQVVWSKQRDYLLLTIPEIQSLSGTIIPVYGHYRIDSHIIGRFPILKTNNTEHFSSIDATDLFLQTDIKWNIESPETVYMNQSYIESVGYLENEILIKTKKTVKYFGKKRTKDVYFSFYTLPEPMDPRPFDHRMGYFYENQYSVLNHQPRTEKGSITRWRLEKKHKDKTLSEPVKPIVFYLDPVIPDKWKPYVKAGILEWLPAFEAAGFKNAIEVKEFPANIEKWYKNSVNHSIVRWPGYDKIRGGRGKSGSSVWQITDWRTGEILKTDITLTNLYHDLSDKYLIRCAPLDKRAQQYPFPDDLMGELIQSVTAHEAGHAFGLRDAHYGEYAYPIEKMRDKKWLEKMGHTPSVMSYARHNHVAQPEDSIPPSLLIQKVGPMDVYQIKWGYRPFVKDKNSGDGLSYLEQMVRQQNTIPWYRYNLMQSETLGPGNTNEVVDNNNPVQSVKLSLKNLKRVIALLPSINQTQPDNALLERLYNKTLELWYKQMQQVMSLIGGYTVQYKSGAQKGAVYTPIEKKVQKEGVEFLLQNAFDVPGWLATPDFLSRIRYSTNTDRLLGYQKLLLSELLDPRRMKRLEQMENSVTYKNLSEVLLSKLRTGLFGELGEQDVLIERRRQELQRVYIGLLTKAAAQENPHITIDPNLISRLYSDYSKSILIAELLALQETIGNSLKRTKDTSTIGHLRLCLRQINMLSGIQTEE